MKWVNIRDHWYKIAGGATTEADAMAVSEASQKTRSAEPAFAWDDPLLLEDALGEDERMVRDTALAYAQDRLMPRILEANRHEIFDRKIMTELGALGLLGPTLPVEYGGAGVNSVS